MQIGPLLAHRRKVGAIGEERSNVVHGSKAARDLLPDFANAQHKLGQSSPAQLQAMLRCYELMGLLPQR